jgi:hypothetical protein
MMICKVFLVKRESKILDIVCATRSFENINKEMLTNDLSDACEVGFQHMSMLQQNRKEEMRRENE